VEPESAASSLAVPALVATVLAGVIQAL
jgi:hypothetical protein